MGRRAVVTIVRHGETDHNKAGIIQGHLDVPLNAEGEAQAAVASRWFRANGVHFDQAWSSDLSRARKVRLAARWLLLSRRIGGGSHPPPGELTFLTLWLARRFVQTAQIILEQQKDSVELKQDERIRERHLGNLQGRRRGDPGTDPRTVEPIPQLRGRLFAFWDSLFPSSSSSSSVPATTSSDLQGEPTQILYVSHGAAIREFVSALIQDRPDTYEVALPKEEEEALRNGSKRIDNCSRTVVEMEEVDGLDARGRKWRGRLVLYADDSHFAESSRAPSPTANADVVDE
ncbi:SPOSA6832_01514, partial [Sporobolomyces salmonicolor]